MDNRRQKRISKFLSYVLRHRPDSIGIELDKHGWVGVDELLRGAAQKGMRITLDELKTVVRENDKQRFSFSGDGAKIRASQGHSIEVDLGYEEVVPPEVLYHGTAKRSLDSIRAKGLTKGNRHHVHLSPDPDTARNVGRRYGKPVVLAVDAGRMHADGYRFYLSANGVWLTDRVLPEYLRFPEGE